MIVKLLFLLNMSSNKHIAFEIIVLVRKNLLNLVKNQGENRIYFNW